MRRQEWQEAHCREEAGGALWEKKREADYGKRGRRRTATSGGRRTSKYSHAFALSPSLVQVSQSKRVKYILLVVHYRSNCGPIEVQIEYMLTQI